MRFGEVAPIGVAWKPDGSALKSRVRNGQEGWSDQEWRLGAEDKGLRVRGLAIGSSPLPWARIQLATNLGLVKGRVGLDRGGVCSRGVRSSFDPLTLKSGTVALSAERRRGGGDGGRPAGSTGGRPTARRNARHRAGGIGVVAASAGGRPEPRPTIPQGRTRRAGARYRRPRVSAQATISDFFAAIDQGVTSTSRPRSGARAGGFAARRAVRLYGG